MSAFPRASTPPSPTPTPEYTAGTFRFGYQSMITPVSVYDYDMATHQRQLKKRQEVPGYDPEPVRDRAQWAVARDGVKVPLSIVYRKGLKKDGDRSALPLWLWLVRLRHAGRIQQQSPEPPRSRHGLRHRPHPRRRRDGRGLAR